MCGITGFWNPSGHWSAAELQDVVDQMANTLRHRGPDDGGGWVEASMNLALGHRRLAIVDLSPEGHQPMVSADDRYVMVFNGEIYNFRELRQQLEALGHQFRGHSDTEIMLASFCQWGIVASVQRFTGMFAFAVWDRRKRLLHLGRDRLGEKPLYYGWGNGTLLFGSELKALNAYPRLQSAINRDAVALFLRHSYIPAPYSIYQDIYKLPPGTILTWNGQSPELTPIPYWSAKTVAEQGVAHPFTGSAAEAATALEQLLTAAVGRQMVADVPLGAFLSGGIDSSTIVALMQSQSDQPVKTFSIGFREDNYDEAQYAQAVAQHLNTDHTELYVTPDEALAVIPQLPTLYDEPYADVSQIPTFLVAQLARKSVTVSLSGDGGDELFGGYKRYFLGQKIWQKIGWMPSIVRQSMAQGLAQVGPWLPAKLSAVKPVNQLHRATEILRIADADAMYEQIVSHYREPEKLVLDSTEPPTLLSDRRQWAQLSDFTQRMMYLDTMTYLPDDILVKVDRASMGVSLESRVPFLDHAVVEFAWQLPLAMKIRHGQGKWLLRQILYKYVPPQLIERPKMGFNVPIGAWLRGPLRDWAEHLINESKLHQQGILHAPLIRRMWAEHLAGHDHWQDVLWNVLMFQAWLEAHQNLLSNGAHTASLQLAS
jgi:asparagine synthase (glutamine-hydrolysing)